MNLIIVLYGCLSSSDKGKINSGLSGNLNGALCNDPAVLYQLSYHNWELVIMWGDYKPIAVEILLHYVMIT